ncbi:MAG TPA: glycosyltransferase family 39 protein [Anaerolineaceae bacterium]|nr:glycosyltransferase family 39 protein [Anaerolineaceae bacterium]HPN53351.1 glycosyltransferase family 39 protein [Anaerolineaceae bacterium]
MKTLLAWLRRRTVPLLAALILLIGLGVRLVDVTDAPFDFHPTRQLLDAIIARGMYYAMQPNADPALRDAAVGMWRSGEVYEPPILQGLTALSYLAAGKELLWLGRVWTVFFWMLGGLPLFWLAKKLSSQAGALTTLAVYAFLPFAITASRSFQPDPLMVCCELWAIWALVRWGQRLSWRNAALAGGLCGLALLVKVTAAPLLIGATLAVIFFEAGLKKAWQSRQPLLVALLAGLPAVIYYLIGLGSGSTGYFSYWTLSLFRIFLTGSFYGDLIKLLGSLFPLIMLAAAFAGLCLAAKPLRRLLCGLWLGYLSYMLLFPYQITTHEYYHLQMVPLVALSLASIGEAVWARLQQTEWIWRAACLGVILLFAAYSLYLNVRVLQAFDYRGEAAGWTRMGEELPRDGVMVGLVHAYGFPLNYYGWVGVRSWPTVADMGVQTLTGSSSATFEARFAEMTRGARYFLVTLKDELDAQPELKAYLNDHYPLTEGDGYWLYDLSKQK